MKCKVYSADSICRVDFEHCSCSKKEWKVKGDFRNLNLATPMDQYPMPVADMLVDGKGNIVFYGWSDFHR